MRQEIIYSLLAVAAVPVTVNAVIVPTSAETGKADNWTGADEVKASGTIVIATAGTTVTCNLGTLVPGDYSLIIGSFTKTSAITVKVEDKEQTFEATEGTASLTFRLNSTKQVSFSVTPKDDGVNLSNISLNLDYDFDKAGETLRHNSNLALIAINKYGYANDIVESYDEKTPRTPDNEERNEISIIDPDITAIEGVTAGDEDAYEKVYKAYKLYLGIENTTIAKTINDAKASALAKEIKYQSEQLDKNLTDTYAKVIEAPAYAQKGSVDDYTTSEGAKGLKAQYDALAKASDNYRNGEKADGWKDIRKALIQLQKDADIAIEAGGDFQKAYNDAKKAISTYQDYYESQYKNITDTILSKRVVTVISNKDRNELLRGKAILEMKAQNDSIAKVGNKLEEKAGDGNYDSWLKSKEYVIELNKIETAIKGIVTTYNTRVTNFKKADTIYLKSYKEADSAFVANKVALDLKHKATVDAKKTVEEKLAALLKAIDGVNTNENYKKFDSPLNLSTEEAAVETAITALWDAGEDIRKNEEASIKMLKDVATSDSILIKLEMQILGYKDFKPLTVNYKPKINEIKNLSSVLKADIEAARVAQTAETFQENVFGARNTAIKEASDSVKVSVERNMMNYRLNYDAINGKDGDGKSGARKEYSELLKKIEGLRIYNECEEADTVYSKPWMDAKLKVITDIEDSISKYLAITDFSTLYKDTLVNYTKDIEAIATALNKANDNDSIKNAEAAFEAYQSAEALQSYLNGAKAQADAFEQRIKKIEDNAKNDSAYGKKRYEGIAAAIKKVRDKFNAIKSKIDEQKNAEKPDITVLRTAIQDINNLNPELVDIEKKAADAEEKVKKNNEAKKAFGTAVQGLLNEWAKQKAVAELDDAEAEAAGDPWKWSGQFDNVEATINALATFNATTEELTIKDSLVNAKYEAEELQESTYSGKISILEKAIATAKGYADAAQANFLAYKEINDKITSESVKVNNSYNKAKLIDPKGESGKDTAWDKYYANLWTSTDKKKPGYNQSLKNYQADNEKAKDEFEKSGFTSASDSIKALFPFSIKTNLLEKIQFVVSQAESQIDSIKFNKQEHDAQRLALDGDGKDLEGALKAYERISWALSSLPETSLTASNKKELDSLYTVIQEIDKKVEERYFSGKSYDKGELRQTIDDITSKMNVILAKVEEKYDESVQTDNVAHRDLVLKEIANAKTAFQEANDYMNQFKGIQSARFVDALKAAESESTTLNEKLTVFPAAINDCETGLQTDYLKVIDTTELFDYKKHLNKATKLKTDIDDAKANYKKAIDDKVSVALSSTITDYEAKRNSAYIAINEFTVNGKAMSEADKKAALLDVNNLIDNLNIAKDATDIATLDRLLNQAADSTSGISSMIKKDVNAAAAKPLETILKQCEGKLADYNEYMAKQSKELQDSFEINKDSLISYRKEFNDLNAKLQLAEKFTVLKKKYQDWLSNNTAAKIMAVDEKYNALLNLIAERETALAAATTEIEKYAAAGSMKKNELANIQKDINDVKDTVDKAKGDAKELDKLFDTEKKDDNLKLIAVDDKIKSATTDSLKTAEYNYLVSAINDLTSVYYKLEAKDAEAATEYKEKIFGDLKSGDEHKVLSLKEQILAIKNDKNKAAAEFLPFEKTISDLLTAINTANGVDNSEDLTKLNTKLDAIAEKATLSNYSDAIRSKFKAETDALTTKISTTKSELATANLSFSKDKFEDTIAQLDKEADALDAKAKAEAKKEETAAEAFGKLDDILKALEDKLKNATDTLNNTDLFEKVNSNTFSPKLNRLATSITNQREKIESDIAGGIITADSIYNDENDTYKFWEFKKNTESSVEDVKNTAARREIIAFADELAAKLKTITYKASNYTDDDAKGIETRITNLKDSIGAERSLVNGDYHPTGLYLKAKGEAEYIYIKEDETPDTVKASPALTLLEITSGSDKNEGLVKVKAKVKEYAEEIEALIKFISDNTLAQKIIPGDITRTGEVTDDDVEAMIKKVADLPADFEPTEQELALLDVNGDGKVNIGDVIATYNVSVGLNWDGSDPDYTGARQKAAENAEQGNVSIEATGLGNGVTRLVLTLDSPMEFIAFQTDVLLANGVKIVGEQLSEAAQGLTLTTNDVTDTRHRVMGYSFSSSINNGSVLQIDVEGGGAVAFDDIYFTTRSAKTYKFEVNGITGISTVSADTQDKTVYDLRGKVVKSLKKGVNLVRDAFGNVKKILVK